MMITGIDFVALPVTDLARAGTFYSRTLGLGEGHAMSDEFLEFDLGDGPALALDAAPFGAPGPIVTGSVAIAVQDVDRAAAAFEAQSRSQREPFESPVGHGAFVRDSEGNRLLLHQRQHAPQRDRAIDFVLLPTADLGRARGFYEGVLGLRPAPLQGEGWAEYVLPDGSAIALADARNLGLAFAPVGVAFVGLSTPDLEAAFERLKAAGFTMLDEVLETPVCHVAFIRDTEGNLLALHRPKK